MGPEAGAKGGYVIAEGSIPQITADKASMIGPFLAKTANMRIREQLDKSEIFALGSLPSLYGQHPHGKAAGGGYSQGQTYGSHRRVRFRQDHDGSGKSDSGIGGIAKR